MLQSVPQIAASKPRKIATFNCPTFIAIQVVGPNTLYIAETENQLMLTDDSGLIDALQINQASGLQKFWWNGDLWAAGSVAFKALFVIPGAQTGSAQNTLPYGVVPTV